MIARSAGKPRADADGITDLGHEMHASIWLRPYLALSQRRLLALAHLSSIRNWIAPPSVDQVTLDELVHYALVSILGGAGDGYFIAIEKTVAACSPRI